jgi:hypothetical protein
MGRLTTIGANISFVGLDRFATVHKLGPAAPLGVDLQDVLAILPPPLLIGPAGAGPVVLDVRVQVMDIIEPDGIGAGLALNFLLEVLSGIAMEEDLGIKVGHD